MYWFIVASTALFCIALAVGILISGFRGSWHGVTQEHFATVVGLPCAAILALAIVLLLRNVSGEVELKVAALEFKGATGPIIMWIGCFLAIVFSIWSTWNLRSK